MFNMQKLKIFGKSRKKLLNLKQEIFLDKMVIPLVFSFSRAFKWVYLRPDYLKYEISRPPWSKNPIQKIQSIENANFTFKNN
jgi:hypothetical protein